MTGYTDADIASAWLACVQFLAADPDRINRSLRRHRDNGRGRCVECQLSGEPWPCVQHRLTVAAIEALASIPNPREAPP